MKTLHDWLKWQTSLNPKSIELGLSRIRQVWERMGSPKPAPLVISVAGTNGKGSCVAFLESILIAAGYSLGAYTSPHLDQCNERFRINQQEINDKQLCDVFNQVDAARQDVPLTYFEFGTLAAIHWFQQYVLDVVILEVGLGGRLDAVNLIDADVALVTNVELDHMEWLGNSRELIGAEKAGIFREQGRAVYGGISPPKTLLEHAEKLRVDLIIADQDFGCDIKATSWDWCSDELRRHDLPLPLLAGRHQVKNASAVLAVLAQLPNRVTVDQGAIRQGLLDAKISGRIQVEKDETNWLFDVAHNPAAADELAIYLKQFPIKGQVYALLGMMADKDAKQFALSLEQVVGEWHLVPVSGDRGQSEQALHQKLADGDDQWVLHDWSSINEALASLTTRLGKDDWLLVIGSFFTVSDAMKWRRDQAKGGV